MRVELPAAQITAEVKFLGSGVPATARLALVLIPLLAPVGVILTMVLKKLLGSDRA